MGLLLADFAFCLLALDWGCSAEDTAARLVQESMKTQENGEGTVAAGDGGIAAPSFPTNLEKTLRTSQNTVMRRAFRYRLWTNANYDRELGIMLESHRRLYNACPEQRKTA